MGAGSIVSKEKMQADKCIPSQYCASVFLKTPPAFIPKAFLNLVYDNKYKLDFNSYFMNYRTFKVDDVSKKMILRYHPYREALHLDIGGATIDTQTSINPSKSPAWRKPVHKPGPVLRTALDDLVPPPKDDGKLFVILSR